ncbi:unnamed protein product [Ceutorhynchus assimilis]|uniref:Uncharacterized protein n=1 Tax=Ceutorhynchus assimilis TaxID=467358 RepID=A0A9N9MZ37_9CUCU|nr:unnamed protein product [Ceutorhynchus assimilis]
MNFHQLLLFLIFLKNSYAGTRVYFKQCAKNGFTCFTNSNKKVDIVYDCSKGVDDVIFFHNQFSAPSNIDSLKIQNCNTLSLATRCSGEMRPISKLEIYNIKNLIFQRLQYDSMLPPTVIFENVSNIDSIPTKSFNQIIKSYYSVGCYVQPKDFQNVYFRNVTIDTIQSDAFVALNQFKNFSFIGVNIKRIQTHGIRLMQDFKGGFEMKNCVIDTLEYMALQIYGKRTIFADNHFSKISSSGINGTMEDFYFTDNFVETLYPLAFSILGTNIFILQNNFLYMKSSALESLSPGLIQDSGRNFGKLRFVYDFSKNTLSFTEAGSLHPDYVSYENVQTEMMFSRNKILCSCDNLGWLFSPLGHGPNTAQIETFYEMVLDEAYGNECDHTCKLPVRVVEEMIECGKCLSNVSLEYICDKNNKATTAIAVGFNDSEIFVTREVLNPGNYTIGGSSKVELNVLDMFGVVLCWWLF